MDTETILAIAKEAPLMVFSLLVWFELRSIRVDAMTILNRIDERLKMS